MTPNAIALTIPAKRSLRCERTQQSRERQGNDKLESDRYHHDDSAGAAMTFDLYTLTLKNQVTAVAHDIPISRCASG